MSLQEFITHIIIEETNQKEFATIKTKALTTKANLVEDKLAQKRYDPKPYHKYKSKNKNSFPYASNTTFKRMGNYYICGKSGHHITQYRYRVVRNDNRPKSKANLVDKDDITARVVSQANLVINVNKWVEQAIRIEINSIKKNNTWKLVDLPGGEKAIQCKWIFKKKLNLDRSVDKYKARLIAKGFTQKLHIDYFDTFTLVARISSIWILISLELIHNLVIHQMDVKTTFLNVDLDEEIYMTQPEGCVVSGQENK
ncbi:hypothetical protein CR513_14732, partial [Mucuna pruriens]